MTKFKQVVVYFAFITSAVACSISLESQDSYIDNMPELEHYEMKISYELKKPKSSCNFLKVVYSPKPNQEIEYHSIIIKPYNFKKDTKEYTISQFTYNLNTLHETSTGRNAEKWIADYYVKTSDGNYLGTSGVILDYQGIHSEIPPRSDTITLKKYASERCHTITITYITQ